MDGTKQTDITVEADLHARAKELLAQIGEGEGLVTDLECLAELLVAVSNSAVRVDLSCLHPVSDAASASMERLSKWYWRTHALARGMAR